MTTFVVSANFVAEAGIPANTLSGTMDITAGQITAVDFIVGGFASHFTEIWFNEYFNFTWLISAYNANNDMFSAHGADYVNINFTPVPGPYLIDFTQARITNGYVDTFHMDPLMTTGTLTYYGAALGGTICPLDGCAPFLVHNVPGPIVGVMSPLFTVALLACVMLRKLTCPSR
jgi:hypothetical protein